MKALEESMFQIHGASTFGAILQPTRAGFYLRTSLSCSYQKMKSKPWNRLVWLHRVGLDNIAGFLDGGMFAWVTAGLRAAHVPQLSIPELHERISGGSPLVIVDVRANSEYETFHIENSINIPVQDLRKRYHELDPEAEKVVICSTGHRSSMACSILKQHGLSRVNNAAGGMTGYNAAGFGPECPICALSWAGKAGKEGKISLFENSNQEK